MEASFTNSSRRLESFDELVRNDRVHGDLIRMLYGTAVAMLAYCSLSGT